MFLVLRILAQPTCNSMIKQLVAGLPFRMEMIGRQSIRCLFAHLLDHLYFLRDTCRKNDLLVLQSTIKMRRIIHSVPQPHLHSFDVVKGYN